MACQGELLKFIYWPSSTRMIATGAIKNNSWHQEHVAEDAGVPLPSAEYLGEVGYIHTAEGHRRHGHGDRVLASLLEAAGGKELFATIQSKNKLSQRLLARNGYVRVGKSWPSNRVDDRVNLYIRPKAAPKAGG
ncbi:MULTISPECIES: GNAT family N-acetyltransferase [unclassified Mesorhizobium]|uniref:GNAT family N-acetyltransferase n=1 Tax=unclassified Mesorhizobium TaxID=325217 RepID=UPI001FDF8BD1